VLFDDYAFQTRALEITREHGALLDELHRIALARYEAGEGSQQDPLLAETERARLLRREIALRSALRVTAHRLNQLLHRRGSDPLPPPAAPPAPDPSELASLEARAVSEALPAALAHRPELRAAEARVEERAAAVSLAHREFFPDLTLRVAHEGLMQESELRPVLGVSFPIPLQIRRRRAAVEEASARLEGARRDQESVEDAVRFDVESAIERLRDAREALAVFREQILPASEDRIVAARAGYEAGIDSFLVLIEAERDLREARIGYEETLADVRQRLAELDRATGRLPAAEEE
jgi:outer membrane protein, heavy metal efflux system